MEPNLSALADDLEKLIGDNEETQTVTNWLDTGDPELNFAISGRYDGGIPYGRIVEMYGPPSSGKTAEATDLMIRAQEAGGIAMFFDWERSFDINLAKNLGLKTERPFWIYKKPETWEEGNVLAMRAVELIRNSATIPDDAPIICVFDSVASAIPQSVYYDNKGKKREIDTFNMSDNTALARASSTSLKVIAQTAEKYNATFLYLNQQRTKIGVMFGDPTCLRAEVQVPFVDGTSATMKQIVDGKISKEVWSWNEVSGQLEPKRIIGWHNNGSIKGTDKEWYHIRAVCPETRNGMVAVSGTNDHKVQVKDKGWINFSDVRVGDYVITRTKRTFAGTALEFLKGLIGFDSHMARVSSQRQTAALIIQDNENPEYAQWKVDLLSRHLNFVKREITISKGNKGHRYESCYTHELMKFYDLCRCPHTLFKDGWTPMQLAIAVMDDGNYKESSKTLNLSFKRLRGCEDELDAIGQSLYQSFGLTYDIRYGQGRIDFDVKGTAKIAELIAQYVPVCMQYKLPIEYRGRYVALELDAPVDESVVHYAEVTEMRLGSKNKGSVMYDITVEDNHNFLAGNTHNGFLVHNCTPGGSSFEYYASVRIALGRTKLMETVNGKKQFVGQDIATKIVKTKLTKPFQETTMRMWFDKNGVAFFDRHYNLVEFLKAKGILKQSGAYIEWTDGKKYHLKSLCDKLKADPTGLQQLRALIPKISPSADDIEVTPLMSNEDELEALYSDDAC
ncbi:RecA/RadA recombinase [Acinetobacter baumannii]|uniref:recombinase RecA n=1 Tax=Acinetobacter baumannii TaxID=470 RepID=UPI000DE60081|nr:recombinase RecA [Acinetobacter baumannii]SSP00987.1 RecA/RadA recombinase [Acinetobacter baumannii]